MTSVIMIFEITRDYSIIVPLMIANMISYFISSRLQEEPIYEAMMHQDGIHLPVAARDRDELLPVKLGMRPPEAVLNGADRIERVVATEPVTRAAWPVVDESGLLGVVTRTQLEDAVSHGRGAGKLADLLVPSEAEVYLKELVRTDPDNGSANLGLARIAVEQGDVQNAVNFFHRAIDGSWTQNAGANRMQARFEFVEALGKLGRRTQAQAELLSLVAETPEAVPVRLQAGALLCRYGLPKQAAELYQTLVEKAPQDGDAYAGLGEAEFALDDYRSAEKAFKSALDRKPGDAELEKRLELVSRIVSLDPNLRGLRAAEPYRRSQALMEAALGALAQCRLTAQTPFPESATVMIDSARKLPLNRHRPSSCTDAAEVRLAPCGAAVEGANRPLRASDVFRGSAQKCHLPSLEIRCTLPGWEARAACRSGSGFLYALLIRAPFFFRRLLRSRVRRKNPQPEPVRMKKAVKRSLSRLSDGQACRALRTFPRSLRRQLPRWSALFLILGDFGVRGHAAIGEV